MIDYWAHRWYVVGVVALIYVAICLISLWWYDR